MPARRTPRVIVVMGVSGAGKSSVGAALAARLDGVFLEGDALHTPANIAKMRVGEALDDDDRAPWLAAIAAWIGRTAAAGDWGVVACSALKRSYRDVLRAATPAPVPFVLLDASAAVLRERLARRCGHFMPATLLTSQLAALERPADDECALTLGEPLDVNGSCERILRWLDTCGAQS